MAEKKSNRRLDEPSPSETTQLLKVEELISQAMGPAEQNIVNFKLVQTILYILARQMRLLEQKVEIRVGELRAEAHGQPGAGAEDSDEGSTAYEKGGHPGERRGDDESVKGVAKWDKSPDISGKAAKAGRKGGKSRDGGVAMDAKEGEGEDGLDEGTGVSEATSKTGKSKEKAGGKAGGPKSAVYDDEDQDQGPKAAVAGKGRKEKRGGVGGGAEGGQVVEEGGRAGGQSDDRRGGAKMGRQLSGTSIAISEKTLGKDKILVVGKGEKAAPGAGRRPARVGSIEVVTAQEFAVLEAAVKALMDKASMPPAPKVPENKKLRSDIARGSASLTDTMQAMQLSARVQAAEKGIGNMADLLTQLAATGALPPDIEQKAAAIQNEVQVVRQTVQDPGWVGGPGGPGAAGMTGGPGGPGAGGWTGLQGGPGGPGPAGMMGGPGGPGGPGSAGRMRGPGGWGGPGGPEGPGGPGAGAWGAPAAPEGLDFLVPSTMSAASKSRTLAQASSAQSGRSAAPTQQSYDSRTAAVTQADLDGAMAFLRDDIVKKMLEITQKANTTADTAAANIRNIMDKMDKATNLDSRITVLTSMVNDYKDQLSGLDTGLSSQMVSFQEQMMTIRAELEAGLTQLEQVNNNAETAAVLELTERYEGLVSELDATLHAHQGLTAFQRQLSDELKSLVETVEQMREQKADRDEVLDGLRDKADITRLAGLLSEQEFQVARDELDMRIQMCYDKFRRQDSVWMNVMNDFAQITDSKAELTHLLGAREETQEQLQELNWKVQQLAKLLGDPKAAIIARKLAKDATCALCRVPALMDTVEPIRPVAMPAARADDIGGGPAEPTTEEPCLRHFNLKEIIGPESPKDEVHMCQRWVGGSHTMIGALPRQGNVARERAPPLFAISRPAKHYLGEGIDGKLYNLEEDLLPCKECNQIFKGSSQQRLSSQKVLASQQKLTSRLKMTSHVALGQQQKIPGEAETPVAQAGGGDQDHAMSHRVILVDPETAARNITVVGDSDLKRADTKDMDKPHPDEQGDMGDDGDEHVPKLKIRASEMSRGSAIVIGEAAVRETEIGQSVHGHVTVVDEETAMMSSIKLKIEEDKADLEGQETEGAGEGDPPPAPPSAEEVAPQPEDPKAE